MHALERNNTCILRIVLENLIMSSVRWESQFPYTLAFNLFKQHIEEINRVYWAFVPTANTIKSFAKKNLVNDEANPKTFF